MEARITHGLVLLLLFFSLGASYRTQNFVVTAATPQLARELGETSESLRQSLALEWLGKELPPWREPVPVRAEVAPKLGAGGVTTFVFIHDQPGQWTMSVQGSRERVLDSVLPHEITHTIFATHFGRPLPRWADEGACTTVEHISERQKHDQFLIQFLKSDRGIPFNRMFVMSQYPKDILPLYSQGYSLAKYLIAQGGRQKFVRYVGDGMRSSNWTQATQNAYGFRNLSDLQVTWLKWVSQGSPAIDANDSSRNDEQLASRSNAVAPSRIDQPARGLVAVVPLEEQSGSPPIENDSRERKGVPASFVSVSSPPSDGWYARQKSSASNRGSAPNAENRDRVARSTASRPHREPEAEATTMSRPQSPQGPKQTVLEWSREPATAPNRQSIYADAPRMWR